MLAQVRAVTPRRVAHRGDVVDRGCGADRAELGQRVGQLRRDLQAGDDVEVGRAVLLHQQPGAGVQLRDGIEDRIEERAVLRRLDLEHLAHALGVERLELIADLRGLLGQRVAVPHVVELGEHGLEVLVDLRGSGVAGGSLLGMAGGGGRGHAVVGEIGDHALPGLVGGQRGALRLDGAQCFQEVEAQLRGGQQADGAAQERDDGETVFERHRAGPWEAGAGEAPRVLQCFVTATGQPGDPLVRWPGSGGF